MWSPPPLPSPPSPPPHDPALSSASQAEHFSIHTARGSAREAQPQETKPPWGGRGRVVPPAVSSSPGRRASPSSSRSSRPLARSGSAGSPSRQLGRGASSSSSSSLPAAASAHTLSSCAVPSHKVPVTASSAALPPAEAESASARSEDTRPSKSVESQEILRENEQLRLHVQALRDEQLYTAELHSQVIAEVVKERNDLVEKLEAARAGSARQPKLSTVSDAVSDGVSVDIGVESAFVAVAQQALPDAPSESWDIETEVSLSPRLPHPQLSLLPEDSILLDGEDDESCRHRAARREALASRAQCWELQGALRKALQGNQSAIMRIGQSKAGLPGENAVLSPPPPPPSPCPAALGRATLPGRSACNPVATALRSVNGRQMAGPLRSRSTLGGGEHASALQGMARMMPGPSRPPRTPLVIPPGGQGAKDLPLTSLVPAPLRAGPSRSCSGSRQSLRAPSPSATGTSLRAPSPPAPGMSQGPLHTWRLTEPCSSPPCPSPPCGSPPPPPRTLAPTASMPSLGLGLGGGGLQRTSSTALLESVSGAVPRSLHRAASARSISARSMSLEPVAAPMVATATPVRGGLSCTSYVGASVAVASTSTSVLRLPSGQLAAAQQTSFVAAPQVLAPSASAAQLVTAAQPLQGSHGPILIRQASAKTLLTMGPSIAVPAAPSSHRSANGPAAVGTGRAHYDAVVRSASYTVPVADKKMAPTVLPVRQTATTLPSPPASPVNDSLSGWSTSPRTEALSGRTETSPRAPGNVHLPEQCVKSGFESSRIAEPRCMFLGGA